MNIIEETHDMTKGHQQFDIPNFLVFQGFDDSLDFFEKSEKSKDFSRLTHWRFDFDSNYGANDHIVPRNFPKSKIEKEN